MEIFLLQRLIRHWKGSVVMTHTLDIIHNRKSVRAYEDVPIRTEDKEEILHAAMRAPTAGNMMLYSIIEIQDQKMKDTLVATCTGWRGS